MTDYTGGNSSGNLSNVSEGFTGWNVGTFTFTATGASDLLTLSRTALAAGACPRSPCSPTSR